jgi:hypothetical protein
VLEAAESAETEAEGVFADAMPIGSDAAAEVLSTPVLGVEERHVVLLFRCIGLLVDILFSRRC